MNETEQVLFPLYKPLPPFMKFPNGFGYMGVIMESRTTGRIQCHLCGKTFKNIDRHLYHSHDMDGNSYRELVGLNKYTPLVCESTSQKLRQEFLNLSESEHEERLQLLKNNSQKCHESGRYIKRKLGSRVQYLNSSRTCDLQAKAYFWEEYKKLGRIPSGDEVSGRLRSLIYTRFNSYPEALKKWGIRNGELKEFIDSKSEKAYQARAKANFYPKYEKNVVVSQIKNFYDKEHRLPTWTEALREGFPNRSVFQRLFGTSRKNELEKIILT